MRAAALSSLSGSLALVGSVVRPSLKNRLSIGIDRIMLEIDFPHRESNWPKSRKRAFELPYDECSLIMEENTCQMLNFPRVGASALASV